MMRVWVLVCVLVLGGCAHSAQQRAGHASAMDRVVDGMGELGARHQATAVRWCDAEERAAAELPDLQEARETVGTVRSVCDKVFSAFRTARHVLAGARETIDAYREGSAGLERVMAAMDHARRAYVEAVAAMEEAGLP